MNFNNTTSFVCGTITADTARSWDVNTNPTKRHKGTQIWQIFR